MDNFILTVLIAAYNHEDYIHQTLDGVLNQETDFQFKILITDDASSDKTQSIIQEYIDKFPNRIFPLFNSQNIGLNATLKKAITLIDTKYTSILGGDDYWVDYQKLQKEVDYLESHPETSYVHTGYKTWIEESATFGKFFDHWEWKMPKEREERLISFLNHEFTYYPCASTSCFRTEPMMMCLNKHPQILEEGIGEGTLINAGMCMYGEGYYYISDLTTVYRIRKKSLSHDSDTRKLLKYYLSYPKLKAIAFKSFNIIPQKYEYVIKKNLDEFFVFSYSKGIRDCFKEEIGLLGFDDYIVKKYVLISSNAWFSFIYYWYVRFCGRLRRLIHCK